MGIGRMRTTIQRWTGREVRALREARRMSIREFAKHLGVSDRMISKWETRAETITPRPINQEALDTSLARCNDNELTRFNLMLGQAETPGPRQPPPLPATPQPESPETGVRHPVDGKPMVLVPAGLFLAGPDNEPVWVDAFHIDTFPTTNADYARFLTATGRPPPTAWDEHLLAPDLRNHPVVYVTWHDATAYAQWAGKQLPTAQQWEKAARGPDGDTYPWGNQPTPAKCNVRESQTRTTTPVDCYHSGVSPYGVYDLCGNTWEWCATQTAPGRHVLKGSAFTSPFHRATPANFNDAAADMRDDDTSFRCIAQTPHTHTNPSGNNSTGQ